MAPGPSRRQRGRRGWRIGQPRDCYIYYMYYQGTMQHRAMSLMSKKMAAALALEGEFSEEGLAAMAGEGDEQMALAKSMSEKIDDADMQRSWSKVKSLTDKKKPPKKRSIPTLADMAAEAKPDTLDTLREDAELLARTILERKKKPIPAAAMPDIISLAERFAKADEGMWGAARAMAYREEVPAKLELTCSPSLCEDECSELPTCVHEPEAEDVVEAETLVGTFTLTDAEGNVLAQATNKIRTLGVNDTITVNPTVAIDGGEPVKLGPKLKVHQPEPEKKVHAVFVGRSAASPNQSCEVALGMK